MVRGLYTAYTGMANEQKRLDIISNNLANSATVGYKEENVTSKSFKDFMITKIRDGSEAYVDREIGVMNPGVKIGETYMNWDQGSLRETDNTYDMAIQGNGFFAIKVVDKMVIHPSNIHETVSLPLQMRVMLLMLTETDFREPTVMCRFR